MHVTLVDDNGDLIEVSNPLPVVVDDSTPVEVNVQQPVSIDDNSASITVDATSAAPLPMLLQDPTEDARQARLDASTHSIQIIDYAHHEIHSGSTFSIHLANLTFANAGEMGVLFKTPAGAKWFHLVYAVDVATKSIFDILEAPTIDINNYPTTFYVPRNRNRNSDKVSTAWSVKATPAANEVSLILDGDTTPVSADGLVLHTEVVGGAKNRSASDGHSHDDEYILKADTVYYFRVKGDGTGTAGLQLSMEIIYYEHTDKS